MAVERVAMEGYCLSAQNVLVCSHNTFIGGSVCYVNCLYKGINFGVIQSAGRSDLSLKLDLRMDFYLQVIRLDLYV